MNPHLSKVGANDRKQPYYHGSVRRDRPPSIRAGGVRMSRPGMKCLLDCIHHLLTETTSRSTTLQELLSEQQRMQLVRYQ